MLPGPRFQVFGPALRQLLWLRFPGTGVAAGATNRFLQLQLSGAGQLQPSRSDDG